MLYCHPLIHAEIYIYILDTYRRNDNRRMINDAWRKTQEDFFTNIFTSHFIARFERVVQGLHVRGCWRPNINFIFWPHCYDRHVVFLVLLMLGSTPSGIFRGPPQSGVAFPTTSGLWLSGILLATTLAPNSTQLYNNSTPTWSPTGSLKSNVIKRK